MQQEVLQLARLDRSVVAEESLQVVSPQSIPISHSNPTRASVVEAITSIAEQGRWRCGPLEAEVQRGPNFCGRDRCAAFGLAREIVLSLIHI